MNKTQSEFKNLSQDLPSRKEEAWRFTSLVDFKEVNWVILDSSNENLLSHDELKKISLDLPSDFYNFVFVDGVLNKTLSDDLSDSYTDQIQVKIKSHEAFVIDKNNVDIKLIKLAEKLNQFKIEFSLQKNQILDKPIQFLFVQSGKTNSYCSQNLELKIDKNAEVIVAVQSISLSEDQKTASNLFVKVNCEEDSRLKLVQIQNENENSYHFSQTFIESQSKSQIQHLNISLGNKMARNYFELKFLGHGANAEAYGITTLGEDQHVDHYTLIHHIKGENQSIQTYKSILTDEAHSIFRGRVRIEQNAQKANSEQLNNNLLLGKKAHADSIPQLEIYADDVKAGHGSTVGQLNDDEIFYLQSRAISHSRAVKMMSEGFAQDLIYKFENQVLVNWLLKDIRNKLERIVTHV